MATKPTLDDARWAETGGGTPAAGITAPSSGKKDVGWVPGEKPAAQIFNHILHEAYKWFKYLSDGAFTGTHSFAGSTSFAGGLTGDTNSTGDFQGDDFYHTDELEYVIVPSDFMYPDGDFVYNQGSHDGATTSFLDSGLDKTAIAPVHLPTDAVVTRVLVYFNRGGGDVNLGLVQTVMSTGAGSAVHSNTVTSGSGNQEYDSGALSYRIGSGLGDRGYELVINPAVAGAAVYGARIKYTRPRP